MFIILEKELSLSLSKSEYKNVGDTHDASIINLNFSIYRFISFINLS